MSVSGISLFLYQGIEEDYEPPKFGEIDGADMQKVSGCLEWNYPLFLILANKFLLKLPNIMI